MWILLVGTVSLIGASAMLWAATLSRSNSAKRLRRIAKTPIHEVREGESVKVSGVVVPGELLRAPYTNRPCVYYRLEMTQSKAGLESIERFMEASCDFTLRDASGDALILVERAKFEVVCDFVEMERASRLSARARDIARRCRWPMAHIAQVELREGIIVAGESVDVVGSATREPVRKSGAGESGYRDAPDTLLVFPAEPMILGKDREQIWIGKA